LLIPPTVNLYDLNVDDLVSELMNKITWRFFVMGVISIAGADPACSETLESAISQAYRYNPSINAERAAVKAAKERVFRYKSGYFPKISSFSNFGKNNIAGNNGGAISKYDYSLGPGSVGIKIVQNLYNGDRVSNQVTSAEKGVLLASENLREIEQKIILKAVRQYMDVLRDNAIIDLNISNIDLLKEQLRHTQERFYSGEITKTALAQIEAQLEAANSDLSSAKASLEISRGGYQEVIGTVPNRLVDGYPILNGIPESIDVAFIVAYLNSPILTASAIKIQIAETEVKLVEGELKPTVDLQASASQWLENQYPGDSGHEYKLIGQLTMPLYDGGEIPAHLREVREILEQRRFDYEGARDNVRLGVLSAWSQHQTAVSKLKSSKAQIVASVVAFDGINEEYKAGQKTTLDVLSADQSLLKARVSLVSAQHDTVVSSYELLSAVGLLSKVVKNVQKTTTGALDK